MDMSEYRAKAEALRREHDRQVAAVNKKDIFTQEEINRRCQGIRRDYDYQMEHLKADAQAGIDAEVKEAYRQAEKVRQARFAELRKAVGDVVAAEILRERLRQNDPAWAIKAYRESIDPGEKAIIGTYAPAIMREKGAKPHEIDQFSQMLAADDKAAAFERQAEAVRELSKEVEKLDRIANDEAMRLRFGV